MRFAIPVLALLTLALGAAEAQAQASKSCSSFVVIEKYDADGSRVKVKHANGSLSKFFPKPEGTPANTDKTPGKCKKSITKNTTFNVTATGGRLSVTQLRTNFEGKMLNDTSDEVWLSTQLEKLIADKTEVVAVIKPGKKRDDPNEITTIYMPANEADLAEIKRLEDQAEDVE